MTGDRYDTLRAVLDDALRRASDGKGAERHDHARERFEDQQIVRLCEWMGSTQGDVFQACKKAIESVHLPRERARAELLGAINYLAAAVIVLDRQAPIDVEFPDTGNVVFSFTSPSLLNHEELELWCFDTVGEAVARASADTVIIRGTQVGERDDRPSVGFYCTVKNMERVDA